MSTEVLNSWIFSCQNFPVPFFQSLLSYNEFWLIEVVMTQKKADQNAGHKGSHKAGCKAGHKVTCHAWGFGLP